MSKKLLFLISFVLLFSLVSIASAQTVVRRTSWWSDLGPTHDWNEPNNWYTMDMFFIDDSNNGYKDAGETMWFVKEPNQVPDINCAAIIGKGEAREIYPLALREMILDGYVMTDPTIGPGMVAEARLVLCGGGESFDPNVGGGAPDPDANHDDPCRHHDLWMTGGTLTVGAPQTWDGYDVIPQWLIDLGSVIFDGQYGDGRLCIGTVPSPGSGTMYMQGGTVNVGGHMEVGAWGATGLLDMTGGEINIVQGLYCPSSYWDAVGHTNLHGGTINAKYLTLQSGEGSTGSMDISEGKMVLERNEVQKIQDYFDGNVERASLTVYGGGHGDIVSDSNYGAAVGKRAAFSLDFSISNDGKTTVQTFLTDPNQAWAPSPPDGATAVRGPVANIKRPILSWSPGDGATSHEVYFDANEALVSARDLSVRKQTVYDPCSWTVDSDLTSLGTYYWAIDENPGPTLGQVWGFTMANLSKAGLPSPGNGATDVNPVADLSWVPGIYASSHDVYFGTNFDDVNDATKIPPFDPNNVFMGNQGPNTFGPDANGLEFGTTYYWRVDECNASGGPEWPGDVWIFTTSDHIDVDDFDSYADTAALWTAWSGTYDAVIGLATDPNIGGDSMMFAYRNFQRTGGSTYWGVEANAPTTDLEVGTDWTASGVEALVLNFYGDAGNGQEIDASYHINNDQMYVALEDGSANVGIVKYYDIAKGYDMNNIQKAEWQEWNIDLEDPCLIGVDMNNVVKVYIGFGGTEKTGQSGYGAGKKTGKYDTVWFDDIALWPIRCVPAFSLATDFTGDCVVDEGDFDIMARDWLITDYSLFGYTGTLTGFPGPSDANYDLCWVTGTVDSNTALYFNLDDPDPCDPYDQGDDYVKIPPLNLNTNTMSITVWLKRHGLQRDDGGIFFCNNAEYGSGTTRSGFVTGGGTMGDDNSLHYNWQNSNKTYSWDPILPILPENEWAFCALTIAPSSAWIYIMPESGTIYSDENTGATHDPEVFGIPSHIGHSKQNRCFVGTMDDFRIYDKTLTAGEIEFLAKLGASGTDPTDANLYAHYTFDDATGLVALDDAGTMVNWFPVPSQANLVDTEGNGYRSVNFRDYVLLARDWLKEPTWPRQW